MALERAPAVLPAKALVTSPPTMEPKIAPAEALDPAAPATDVMAPFLISCPQMLIANPTVAPAIKPLPPKTL